MSPSVLFFMFFSPKFPNPSNYWGSAASKIHFSKIPCVRREHVMKHSIPFQAEQPLIHPRLSAIKLLKHDQKLIVNADPIVECSLPQIDAWLRFAHSACRLSAFARYLPGIKPALLISPGTEATKDWTQRIANDPRSDAS